MLEWDGQEEGGGRLGARYDPLTDAWSPMSTVGAPHDTADDVTAVWSGHYMVLWGGLDCPVGCAPVGGRYNPISDSWLPVSSAGSPGGRANHSAVWTGSRMIVWGGTAGAPV
jgi:hypothetical protein